MRYFPALFLILFISPISAYQIKTEDGKILAAKYTFDGAPIYSDAHRLQVKNFVNSVGSRTVTNADFAATDITQAELDIVDEINQEGGVSSRTSAIKEIAKRKTKAYNLKKIRDLKNEIFLDLQLRAEAGTDVSASTTDAKAKIDTYKTRASQASE